MRLLHTIRSCRAYHTHNGPRTIVHEVRHDDIAAREGMRCYSLQGLLTFCVFSLHYLDMLLVTFPRANQYLEKFFIKAEGKNYAGKIDVAFSVKIVRGSYF